MLIDNNKTAISFPQFLQSQEKDHFSFFLKFASKLEELIQEKTFFGGSLENLFDDQNWCRKIQKSTAIFFKSCRFKLSSSNQ
jgi:hypothetical protein